jgi:hypothetical protein
MCSHEALHRRSESAIYGVEGGKVITLAKAEESAVSHHMSNGTSNFVTCLRA